MAAPLQRVAGRLVNPSDFDDEKAPAQRAVPTTGQTVAMTKRSLVLEPAGTLAALTITLPADPVDGAEAQVCTTATLTALTVAAAASPASQTLANAPTTLAAGAFFTMKYVGSQNKWYRWG